eukprot:6174242-Pleurochrysis_carterae.AAC.1
MARRPSFAIARLLVLEARIGLRAQQQHGANTVWNAKPATEQLILVRVQVANFVVLEYGLPATALVVGAPFAHTFPLLFAAYRRARLPL